MRRIHIFLLVFLFMGNIFAQTEEQLNLLDKYYQKVLNEWHIPGMAVAITNGDKILFSKGYGYANIAKKTKVDGNTLFAIASNSIIEFTKRSAKDIFANGELGEGGRCFRVCDRRDGQVAGCDGIAIYIFHNTVALYKMNTESYRCDDKKSVPGLRRGWKRPITLWEELRRKIPLIF